MMRLTSLIFFLALALPVRAELSCDQLVASAQAGLTLRDQGASLSFVLSETEKPDMAQRFKPDELALIRRAIRLTFTGEVSIYDLAGNCQDGKGSNTRR